MIEMKISRMLFTQAFEDNQTREPRSDAYKAGVLAAMEYRESGNTGDIRNPYELGTADADAWFSGLKEGYSRWRHYQNTGCLEYAS